MNAFDAIKSGIEMSQMISMGYIEDLADQDMMKRPTAGCNHIKWQIGHLIESENMMVETCFPGSMPKLPAGFKEKYTKEKANSDNSADFHSKAELIALYQEQRAATLKAMGQLKEADLDKPTHESMQSYAPTVGAMFSMQGSHWLMHAGQWAVIRRQLGRKPLF